MGDASWRAVTRAGRSFFDVAAAHPGETLLAMDFDGTLAPIVPDPEDSRLDEGAAQALGRLGGAVGHLVVITGRGTDAVRRLGRLDERPGLGRLVVLGQYGVQRYDAATGVTETLPVGDGVPAARHDLEKLLATLSEEGHDLTGVHLEDKGIAIGVHTRRASEPEATLALLTPLVEGIARRHGLHVEPGRLVVELRASTRNKGDALRELVAETGVCVVAMIGDDLGDLPAFAALEGLRADGLVCCGVVSSSREQPRLLASADVVCDGPDGVAAWLNALADRIGKQG